VTISLRAPVASGYDALAAWIPDAKACLHWAGPRIRFPFTGAELQQQLAVAGVSRQRRRAGPIPKPWVRARGFALDGRVAHHAIGPARSPGAYGLNVLFDPGGRLARRIGQQAN